MIDNDPCVKNHLRGHRGSLIPAIHHTRLVTQPRLALGDKQGKLHATGRKDVLEGCRICSSGPNPGEKMMEEAEKDKSPRRIWGSKQQRDLSGAGEVSRD